MFAGFFYYVWELCFYNRRDRFAFDFSPEKTSENTSYKWLWTTNGKKHHTEDKKLWGFCAPKNGYEGPGPAGIVIEATRYEYR